METGLLKSKDIFGKPKTEKLGSQFGGGWSISEIVKKEQEAVAGIKKSADIFGSPTKSLQKAEEISIPETPVPKLEDMKIQENNIAAMGKTYTELGVSLDTDYKQYTELGKQLDKVEADMQEAPEDMMFSLNEKRNVLVTQHNELVDKLKADTKKHQSLYMNLDKESKTFNANIGLYNKYIQTQAQETEPDYIPEGDLKDNIDAFRLGMADLVHKGKQYFPGALANLIYADIKVSDTVSQYSGMTQDKVDKLNEFNKGRREKSKEIYQRSEKRYDKWLVEHPELVPRPEWSQGVIENVKKDPKILLDPAYWGYEAMQSASFMLTVMGTTLGVTAATGNPLLGMAAGVGVAYPSQAQDLWEELVANGATEEQASKIAVPLGMAIASVEVLGDLPLLAAVSKPFKKLLFKGIKKEITKRTALSLAKSGVKTFFAVEGAEIMEENIQLGMQEAAVNVFRENVSLLEKIPETTVKTFMATAPWAMFGGAANVRSNINERLKQKIAENNIKTALEKVELPEEKKEEPTPEKVAPKIPGVTFEGQQIADEAKEMGSDQGGISDYLSRQIAEENYTVVEIKIDDLKESDSDLEENLKAGIRPFEGEPFAMLPIVTSKGEVLDGYNRIAQLVADGNKTIEVLRGVPKVEPKEPWQMTKEEYLKSKEEEYRAEGKKERIIKNLLETSDTHNHAVAVGKALAKEMPIPEEVLADYPDIKPVEDIFGEEEETKTEEKAEGEVLKTAISYENAVKALEEEATRLGKPSWEKLSRTEVNTLLDNVKAFKDPEGKLLKKVGKPDIDLWKDEDFAITGILAGEKVHKITDSHWIFIDDKVADEVLADQKKRMFNKQVKDYMKRLPDVSKAEAEEYTEGYFKKIVKDRPFPNWKDVVKTAEEARTKGKVYIQGHKPSGIGKENHTILSNGDIQVLVNSDYLNMMNKWLPDAEIQLGKTPDDMVSFVGKKDKIQAVLMPVRYEDEVLPFNVKDIPGQEYTEGEGQALERPGVKEGPGTLATKIPKKKLTQIEYQENEAINKKFVELHRDEIFEQINKIKDRNTRLLLRDSYNRITEGKPIDTYMDHLLKDYSKDEIPLGVEDIKPVLYAIYDLNESMMRKQSIYPEQYTNYDDAMVKLDRVKNIIRDSQKIKGIEKVAPIRREKSITPETLIAEQPTLFDFGEYQELSARTWDVKLSKEAVIPEKINKTQIMTWAGETFGIPIKSKATHKWKSAGTYYPRQQIIRMEKWGELSVLTHEIAHDIDLKIQKKLFNKWKWGKLKGITGEFTKELADLDYDQSQRRTSEGFAEYMRHRLTTGLAEEKAPNFHKYFNESILPQFPELKKNLDTFKEKLDIWNKQGAENRIIQHIDWKGEHTETKGIIPKLRKALEWVFVRFNDEFYFPQKITAEIEKVIGKKLTPSKNPAIMMEYSKSKAGAIARTYVMDKAIDEAGNVVGDGLIDVLKPIADKEMKQFIAYAVSKRAVNLSGRGIESGFDIEDAKFIINKYKDKGWDDTVKNLTNWSNHALDWLVRAGGLDKETTQLMRDLNPVYLPFKRAFIDEIGVIKGTAGYVDTGKGVKRIKGSGRPIINPLESMVSQMRELVAKAQKIRIAKIFIDLSKSEGIGGFITKVPAPMKATTFSANQIKSYLDEIAGGEEGITSNEEYNEFLTVFTQDFKFSGKENIVSIWKDGKQEFYEIHPDLYEAFKGVDPLKLGPITKIFAPFSRMLRLGATGLKLSFGLARNPFRDAFSYAVFSKRNNTTIFDPIKGYYKEMTTKEGEATWRFKKLGGGLSGQIGLDRASVQNSYDEMLDTRLGAIGKVLRVVKHPVNTLADIVSITEMGPRSSEIEASYKRYTSEKWLKDHKDWTEEDAFIQAFCDAQDVTVNFTKSGKWAKQINQVTAFFNVSIRGPEKLYRSIRERPIQTFVKGTLWLTTIAVASWYRNKDKDWYKNLPPAYKYNNLFFEIGGNVFRLPIPFELGIIFMSAPQAVLDTMKDKDAKSLEGLLDLAKAQIPDPTPSVFQPAINIATNKNYLGVPIESEGMQYLYPTERKRDYTTKLAIELSKGMDKIGIQLSPIQLDYMLDSYSGGFLRQFRITGEELSDLPVLGDLMLRDPSYPKRQLNEYFSDWEVLRQRKQSGIATRAELRELNRIDGFYKTYKGLQGNITKAKKANNQALVVKYSNLLRERLGRYGYK